MTHNFISVSEIDFASLDLLPYGIIVLDIDGNVVFYNEREEQIAGNTRVDVLGRNFFTEIAPCTQVAEFFGRFKEVMATEGVPVEFSFHFPFKPEPRDVEIAMTGFRVDARTLCLVSVRDVTETEFVRDRILSSQKLADVGEVASGVAHNFNNLLMAIGTWLSVLRRDSGEKSPRATRAIEEMARAVADGRAMVARILAGTSPDDRVDSKLHTEVNSVVTEAVAQARARAVQTLSGANVHVDLQLGESLPDVLAPPGELREVVVNLISNAFDALGSDGKVVVRTGCIGAEVSVAVHDSGVGMSEAVQRKMFRPLFTTKGSLGTGLGLSSSYATIRRLGGRISVESTVGVGSTFTITLPAAF